MTFRSRIMVWVAMTFLIAANGVALRHWSHTDTRPLAWDQSIHTKAAYIYQDRLAHEPLSLLNPAYFNYPPLYHISLVPFLNRVHDIADAGVPLNFLYLCLLLLSVYWIGKELIGPWQGVTAAFLVSAYPIIFDQATQTMIDLSLTAWIAFNILCLIKSEKFSSLFWSMAFGITLGLGMLTKWTHLAYVIGPLVVDAVPAIRSGNSKKVGLALALAALLMLPWYVLNIIPMLARISHVSNLPPASGFILKGIASVLWYPISLFEQIGFLFVLLLIPGLVAIFWQPKLRPVFLWFVVSLILFTCIHNRNTRYSMPALPAAALLTVAWLPTARKIPLLLLNLLIAGFFLVYHLAPQKTWNVSIGSFTFPVLTYHEPRAVDWKHKEIIAKIEELKDRSENLARVLTVSNDPYLHSTTLNISLKKAGVPDITFRGPSKRRFFEFADFILLKTGDLGPEFTITTIKACSDAITQQPDWFKKVFKEVARWPLPDGSEAILYQLAPQQVSLGDTGILNISLERLELPNVTAEGVNVNAVPINKSETQRGRLKQLVISCKKVAYKTIDFENIRIVLENPQVNLPLFLETQELQMLTLEKIHPEATVSASSLLSYAARKAKWLKDPTVNFQGSRIDIAGNAKGLPLFLSLNAQIEGTDLVTHLNQLRLVGIPFPKFMIKSITNRRFSLLADDDMPYDLDIQTINGSDGKLSIN